MDEKILQQILDEIFPSFEALEARGAAALQFLKDKGVATEEDLAPYIRQAETAASVRWRATRARVNYLLLSVVKDSATKAEGKTAEPPKESENQAPENKQQARDKLTAAPAQPEDTSQPAKSQQEKRATKPAQEKTGSAERGA